MPRFLSIVVPAYREAASLPEAIQAIAEECARCDSRISKFEIIVVDDGSPDETWSVLTQLQSQFPQLRGVRLSRNFGKEGAMLAGLSIASGDGVIVLDADMQHPIELIGQMVILWVDQGYDIVNAVKADRKTSSLYYRFSASLYDRLLSAASGLSLARSSDFKLLDRKVVDALLACGERRFFFRGIVAWLGFNVANIPMQVRERQQGTSRWKLRQMFALAITGLSTFSTTALHGVTVIGGLFLIGAIALGCHTAFKWASGQAVQGFATVIILQLFIGSLLMIALGIIGEYLSTIYYEVKGRPRFVITQTIGGGNAEQ